MGLGVEGKAGLHHTDMQVITHNAEGADVQKASEAAGFGPFPGLDSETRRAAAVRRSQQIISQSSRSPAPPEEALSGGVTSIRWMHAPSGAERRFCRIGAAASAFAFRLKLNALQASVIDVHP